MNYTIAQAAERCGLTAHTLRFYDKEGLLPFVNRDKNGNRRFKDSDFEYLKVITCLKNTGMKVKEIRQYIDWCMEGDSTLGIRLEYMRQHKRVIELQMEELQRHMTLVDYKITHYEKLNKACEPPPCTEKPA